MKPSRDRFERMAQRLWRRWYRAALYAREHSRVDAMLRFRLHDYKETRGAMRDVMRGEEGLAYMLTRARRVARLRMRRKTEDLLIRLAHELPTAGRHQLAAAALKRGYDVGASTVRRVLQRCGHWCPIEPAVPDEFVPEAVQTRSKAVEDE